jgi:tRNA threonylcarbamoyladenosine biosynthesis protein TsaB
MLILAFDTTGPHGSASLFREAEQVGEVRSSGQTNYSVALFEMVSRLLDSANFNLADVEIFAAATGPGSFTGIRVGLAAAQAWAKAFGRPVCGVSVLEAMVNAAQPGATIAVPLLDARRAEFYLGVFRREVTGEGPEFRFSLSGEGMVMNAAGVASLAEHVVSGGDAETVFILRENDEAAFELSKQLPASLNWGRVSSYLSASIARVAWQSARAGQLQQPEELDAWYIRRSDAEINWPEPEAKRP